MALETTNSKAEDISKAFSSWTNFLLLFLKRIFFLICFYSLDSFEIVFIWVLQVLLKVATPNCFKSLTKIELKV